ncbi:hypothetical protein [Streptomyces sp. NPDC059708]|uniref:hypothetical protein n=1 Tax=Streptomyces sp. NPDC059708 TaxID=3346916 RepID=UPI0036B40034
MQTTPGLPEFVSITALNLRETAYAVLCLPCGGGGAPTTIETRRGPWARPDAWMAAKLHADAHERAREEVVNSARWHRQAAVLGWSAAQAEVMWWASRGHLHHDQAGYYRMDPTDPRVRRGRAVARARVLSLVDAGLLDHDGQERGPVALTQDGRDARRAWDHAGPEPVEVESRYLRPLLDGHEDTARRAALAERAARREAERAEREARMPRPVEPAAAPSPDQCPHTPVWLVLAASVTGQLSHRMECACGTTQALYPGKSPAMDRGTATRPTGIREASVTTTTGWARQQGYQVTGPWTVLDQNTKRAPIHDEDAPVRIPLVIDPNRHPTTAVTEPAADVEQDQAAAEDTAHEQLMRGGEQDQAVTDVQTGAEAEQHEQERERGQEGRCGDEDLAVVADKAAAALLPAGPGGETHTSRPVELPGRMRPARPPHTGPVRRRGRRPAPRKVWSVPARPQPVSTRRPDTGILDPAHPQPAADRSARPVIPHGRLAVTEENIAALTGTSLKTWRRNHAADFRAHVPVLCPGDRLRLYDRAQTLAHLDGRPLPSLPEPGEHPDDLLTDAEAGTVLGVSAGTVRAYAATGYLSPGVELYGRRWWPRQEITLRRDAGDQRTAASTAAVQALTAEFATGAPAPTAAGLAARDRISTRTAHRRLTTARRRLDAPGGEPPDAA